MNGAGVGEDVMISVIVPAYNVQAYLRDALDSLLAQTLESLEIIVVEDGSTDSTRSIVEEYERNSKVRTVYHGGNRGLSAARNTGIRAARGRYIGFLDGDDIADPLMYESMVGAAELHQADVVTCGYSTFTSEGPLRQQPLRFPSGKLFVGRDLGILLRRGHRNQLYWYSPLFIYSRELLSREAVSFDESIRLGEDTLFNSHALRKAERFYAVGKHLYRVRQRPDSMTHIGNPAWNDLVNDQFVALRRFYEAEGVWREVALDYHSYVLRVGIPQAIANACALARNHREFIDLLRNLTLVPWVQESLHYPLPWWTVPTKRFLVAWLMRERQLQAVAVLYGRHSLA